MKNTLNRARWRMQVGMAGCWLALGGLALPARAQVPYAYVTNNGTITLTRYTGTNGTVVIPSALGGLPVTHIGAQAFKDSLTLTNVTVPNSITRIRSQAFAGCTGLRRVSLGNGVTRISEDAFTGCAGLLEFKVDTFSPAYSSQAGILFNKDKTLLIQCPGSKTGAYAIPASVLRVGSRAFFGCSNLTGVVFTNGGTLVGDWAFGNCTGLTSVVLSNHVAGLGEGAFFGCSGLTNLALGSAVTGIGAGAFFGCSRLAEISMDPLNPVYSSSGGALLNKRRTRLLFCPEAMTGRYAIPAGVTRIEDRAFYLCDQLTGITIPAGVTRLGTAAFQGCTRLTSLTIPASVTRIYRNAFRDCENLASFYFRGNVPSFGSGCFTNVNPDAIVHYVRGTTGWGTTLAGLPTQAVDAYEPDNNWTSAGRIRNGRNQRRSIHAAGNVDWAKFAVGSGGARNVTLETSGSAGDTQLWLFKAGGALVAYDNNGGPGSFSRIAVAALEPGTYYVKIREFGNNGTIAAYKLRASWTSP